MTDHHSKKADEVAAIDPLGLAEKLTGASYKDDKATMGLGFLILQDQAAKLTALRQEAGDTHRNCTPDTIRSVLTHLGATCMYQEFYSDIREGYLDGKEGKQDCSVHNLPFDIWVHETEGWIVSFDSFGWAHRPEEITVNSATLYANIRLTDKGLERDEETGHAPWYEYFDHYSGSVYVRRDDLADVLGGSWHVLDGLKSRVLRLRAGVEKGLGEFLTKWIEGDRYGFAPYIYKDDRDEQRERIIACLPEWVQDNIAAEDYIPVRELHKYGK